MTHKAVSLILEEMADLPKLPISDQAMAEHVVYFDPPIYDVWKKQDAFLTLGRITTIVLERNNTTATKI